jgi:hypothetical protein
MVEAIRAQWNRRPWWMNLMWGFCLYMAFAYVPWDLFLKPVERDEEVWFGVTFHGVAAKALAPLHWLVYGLGAYGFWRMKAWMWPWAALYVAQIAIGMAIWSVLDPRGQGIVWGLVAAAVFMVPTIALWRARARFDG